MTFREIVFHYKNNTTQKLDRGANNLLDFKTMQTNQNVTITLSLINFVTV